ncbi:MAG: AtpZ/AtpI family protein [Faecalibacterium sp.]|nr:AtpZ/AtpI family protein [Faecalibacterium sp.]
MNGMYKLLEDIMWLTQLGFSILFPLVFFLWLAHWLVTSHGWPMWVYVPAIVLGLGCAARTFWVFAQRMLKKASKGEKPPRFNRHR